jgi:hypothetical protein
MSAEETTPTPEQQALIERINRRCIELLYGSTLPPDATKAYIRNCLVGEFGPDAVRLAARAAWKQEEPKP